MRQIAILSMGIYSEINIGPIIKKTMVVGRGTTSLFYMRLIYTKT